VRGELDDIAEGILAVRNLVRFIGKKSPYLTSQFAAAAGDPLCQVLDVGFNDG
jgi:hypothetical protein